MYRKKRYRANPAYRGKPWYDWAMVRFELSEEEKKQFKYNKKHNIHSAYPPGYYPSKILAFIRINNTIKVVIHCTDSKKNTQFDSCLTERYYLEYQKKNMRNSHHKNKHKIVPTFRIVDVSNIHDRVYVVEESPGVHSELNKESKLVIHVKKRETWCKYFTDT